MENSPDNETMLNAALRSSADSSSRILDGISGSKEDSLLGLHKKQVILENSFLTGGDTNLNPLEKSATQSASNISHGLIVNERSNMAQNSYNTKRKRDDSPDSSSIALDDEGK
jgi:hypothetical protein